MEQNSMWKNLPIEILEEIMKLLPLREYLAMRSICFPWWISVSNLIAKENYPPLPELPLTLIQSENPMFYSLSTKSLHPPKTQLLDYAQKCHGSVQGLLIVCDYTIQRSTKVFFLNPVTNGRIMIPSKLYFSSDFVYYVTKIVASAKPGSDCYLAALLDDYCHIAIYKPFDNSWTIIEPIKDQNYFLSDVEVIGTKLYVTSSRISEAILLIYDLKHSTNGPTMPQMSVTFPKPKPVTSRIINDRLLAIDLTHCYLAKDEALRELYLIYIKCSVEYKYNQMVMYQLVGPAKVTTVEVFKLDRNKNPIGWQNVRLDDRVAFVSKCKSMIMSRDQLNYNQELIPGNTIYFGLNFPCPCSPWSGLTFGMFCLTNNNCNYFPVDISGRCRTSFPLWFIPSL